MRSFDESSQTPCISVRKSLVHPGEVNRVRAAGGVPNSVFSLTDSCDVYMWDIETQPARTVEFNAQPSIPTLTWVPTRCVVVCMPRCLCVCGQAHGSRSCGGVRDFHFGIFSPRCVWFTEWPHWCVGHQRCCRSSHFVWRAQWAGNQEATPVRAQTRCPQRWWSIACRTYNAHHRTHWYAASCCGVVVARPRVRFDEWLRVFQTPWRGLHWTHTTKLPTCSRPSVMIV